MLTNAGPRPSFDHPYRTAFIAGVLAALPGPTFWLSLRVVTCPDETWLGHIPLLMLLAAPAMAIGAAATVLATTLLRGLLVWVLRDRLTRTWRVRIAAIIIIACAVVVFIITGGISIIVAFPSCI